MTTAIGHTIVDPGTHDDIHGFAEARATLFDGNAENTELARIEAAAGAPVNAAAGENVEQCNLFSQAQRMIERCKRDAGAYTQALGTSGRIGAHHRNRRTYAVIVEVMLRQPDRVVAGLVHDLDTLE